MDDLTSRTQDFEKQIHAMFDHIWDCEIEHPVFQDTVGDLMKAVIQAYHNTAFLEDIVPYDEKHAKHIITVTTEQCNLIINAVDAYQYITSDVMSYDEIWNRRVNVIQPLLDSIRPVRDQDLEDAGFEL